MNELGGAIGRGGEAAVGTSLDAGSALTARHQGSSAAKGRGRALVVESPRSEDGSIASQLGATGFEVRACADERAAFEAFVRELPDLIVARDRLGEVDALAFVRRVRELSDVPVILVDPVAPRERRERAFRLGVDRVVTEPGEVAALPAIVLDLMDPIGRPGPRPRLTAEHVRRLARSELQAELARLLVECRGNLAEMARRMGKDRSTIRYHLRRFGMLVENPALCAGLGAGAVPHGEGARPSHGRSHGEGAQRGERPEAAIECRRTSDSGH